MTSRLRLSQLVCSRDEPATPPTASRTRWVTSYKGSKGEYKVSTL